LAGRVGHAPAAPVLNERICTSFHSAVESLTKTTGVYVAARSGVAASSAGSWAAPVILRTDARTFLATPILAEEVFGPYSLIVECDSTETMNQVARAVGGHLAASIHATAADRDEARKLVNVLERLAGRIVFNGFPTGVEVCNAMQHGGPYPATTHSHFNSIGTTAFLRFVRPICYQDFPPDLLPAPLVLKNVR
jgi:alpha-ketoglutaric semialdehyde dehydrogenase